MTVMFEFKLFILCVFGIIYLPKSEAARVLAYFPTPSISHQVVFRPLVNELVKRGHEVIVVTTDPEFTKETRPSNLTEIDLHDASYELWREQFVALSSQKQDICDQMVAAVACMNDVITMQLNSTEFRAILKKDSKYFDLLLVESILQPPLILSHVFDAPLIQICSMGVFYGDEIMGAPAHPILRPTMMRQRLVNLTNWEKFTELYNHYKRMYLHIGLKQQENNVIKKLFGPNAPTIDELYNNVDMLFLNVHPIWAGNVAVPPAIIYLGGLHQKPEKELPADLKSYLDASTNGVIYLSFGTNIDPALMPQEKVQMFVSVLSKLPYNVLWKWNNDKHPSKSDNIKFVKWFPQSDLLRHKNVKLFITQGGLQSTDEALTAGVPLLGVPMLGDQWYNVEKYVEHKIGVRLDIESISEEKIENAITTVIEDESYQRNAKRLGRVMRDEPQTSLERAVWWTEYVIRHRGAKHLRSPAANISWAEYLELELVGFVLGVLVLVFCVTFITVYNVWKYVKRKLIPSKKVKSS